MVLREHRRRLQGLPDLLPYGALVAEGMILNKDGSFTAGWTYRGPDPDSSTEEILVSLSDSLNRIILMLGDSWMVHVDAVRHPSPGYPPPAAFPHPVLQLIDEERRRQYSAQARSFETRLLFLLTFLPPTDTEQKLVRLLLRGDDPATPWRELLDTFERRLADIATVLGGSFDIWRLSSQALLEHVFTAITGSYQPIGLPRTPIYLDYLLGSSDFVGGFEPRIGSHHLSIISVSGFPVETYSGILAALLDQPFAFRWSNRFLPLDTQTAIGEITRFRRFWVQKRHGLSDIFRAMFGEGSKTERSGDGDTAAMIEDTENALAEASSSLVRYGYATSVLLLFDEDRGKLRDRSLDLLRVLRNRGVTAALEATNAVEAYLGSLPGIGWANVRRPLISSANFADLAPSTSVWSGNATSPNPFLPEGSPALLWASTGTTPFRLNLHSGGDVGHTLIVGPTGSGKSALLALIQAQFFRYQRAQIFTFDKGYSSMPLALAAGAHHYDIAADRVDTHRFCPLGSAHLDAERAWALQWLEQLLVLQGVTPTPLHRHALQRALELLAEAPADSRSLSNLVSKVQDGLLRTALRQYTLTGPYGATFDAIDDSFAASPFHVFEMSHAMELDDKLVVPLLLLLFHRIESALDGRPTLIVIEEAWTFLFHSLFAERIQLWLREMRKRNTSVLFVSQALSDFDSPRIRSVVFESCPTRILLPNPDAATPAGAPLYQAIGLNPRQISLIAQATRKRDYFILCPEGCRLIDLVLDPVALSFVGASSKADLAQIRRLAQEEGSAWPLAWLRDRGLAEAAARLEHLHLSSKGEVFP